jgi:DNA polymerase-3 subunit epsilon
VLDRFFGKDGQRRRALSKTPASPLRDFLELPFPGRSTSCDSVPIVAVDLETTGLDPKTDEILSVGLVEIRGMSVILSTAWHAYVRVDRDIPESSAVIHQITDDHAAENGQPLAWVMDELLKRLAGKVMLVHYSKIEQEFINAACRRLYGGPFVIPIIDTLKLGQRVFERRNHSIQPGDLRLFNLRPRYNLPHYKAHNALSDALSTAELFLAMSAEMTGGAACRIHNFVTG